MSHVEIITADPDATAPEIWFKAQRVIRSVVAALVVLVPTLNLTLPLLAEAFNSPDVPADLYLCVNGVLAAMLAMLGVLTRIMAIPKVNDWLTKIGLGSVPKRALTADPSIPTVVIQETPPPVSAA